MSRCSVVSAILMMAGALDAAHAEGNAENGRDLARTHCARCHGEDGNARSTSFRPVPMLSGQPAAYLFQEMQNYASGGREDRTGDTMTGILKTLSEQDFEDLAAHYASQPRY